MHEDGGAGFAAVVELAAVARSRDHQRRLVEALQELEVVVDLALSRLRDARRWSGTHLVIRDLPELAAVARKAADELAVLSPEQEGPPAGRP